MSIESRISFLPKKSDKESLEKNKESKKFRLTPNSDGLFAGGIATFRELDPIIGSDATLINAHYYPGSMNDLEHEIIIHPFATLFRNYICPEAQFSSFSEYGEAFVHGFQAVSFPNEVRFDGVNEYDQLNLEYFANFIKNNCRHIENLTKDQIVEIVRYYLTGYFAAKEYESPKIYAACY